MGDCVSTVRLPSPTVWLQKKITAIKVSLCPSCFRVVRRDNISIDTHTAAMISCLRHDTITVRVNELS